MLRHITLLLTFCIVSEAFGQVTPTPTPSTPCGNFVEIAAFKDGGILYKPENEHGARGASLIVQNFKYWYGLKTKPVYDWTCRKKIGTLRLWGLGYPYGERYYSKMPGGSGDNGNSLAAKAYKAARRYGGIIIINKSFAVRIKDFRARGGFLRG